MGGGSDSPEEFFQLVERICIGSVLVKHLHYSVFCVFKQYKVSFYCCDGAPEFIYF